jgi:hypothetical protein
MKKMNYEAPVAEMIEMQASMVLMSSPELPGPSNQGGQGGGLNP